MAYEINEAKALVIEAGKKLIDCGLIARTWGNVSARISDTQFVITPSGRAYETLTPDELVIVNIEDCKYEGDIKPSSEKGIHADAYRLRPEINFVIHTHQVYASALSPTGFGIPEVPDRNVKVLGKTVPLAEYGMPSTGKLRENVEKIISNYPDSKAIIMKHHGALCMGVDYDDAFKISESLEDAAKKEIGKFCMELSGKQRIGVNMLTSIFEDKSFGAEKKNFPFSDLGSSRRIGNRFFLKMKDGTEYNCDVESGCAPYRIVPRAALIHSAIYKTTDALYISHFDDKDAVAISKLGEEINPYLDDFSQIAGHTVKCANWEITSYRTDAPDIAKALSGRNAVFVKGMGALCTGTSASDVEAVKLVMDKECKTQMFYRLTRFARPLGLLDAVIMRTVYVLKYSKKATEK